MKTKKGFALVVSLIILTLLMIAIGSLNFITSQSSFRVRKINHAAKALAIAEAGVMDSISHMGTNYFYWCNNSFSSPFENGSYWVTNRMLTNKNVLISSVGKFEKEMRHTTVELLGTEQLYNNSLFDLNGCILSGGDILFSSAAFSVLGNIHGNLNIIAGNGAQNGTINGVVSACGTIGNLQGTLQPGSTTRVLPSFNIESFRQLAIQNGLYYGTNMTFNGVNLIPSNGITFVSGNVSINNKSTINGVMVATGNITVDNNFQQHNGNNLNVALIAGGNIDINNRTQWNGVIFAGGNVVVRNNMQIVGCIISKGYCDIKNKVTIIPIPSYPAWNPAAPNTPPEVIVGGWLK